MFIQLCRALSELKAILKVMRYSDFFQYMFCITTNIRLVLRHRKLWPADIQMTRTISVTYKGTPLIVPCGALDELRQESTSSSFSCVREMYARDVYLRYFDTDRLSWGTVIDAGGNRGFFTVFASQLAKAVIWIEPREAYHSVLDYFVLQNPNQHCEVKRASLFLVGREDGFLNGRYSEEVGSGPKASMSDLMRNFNIQRVSLLKLDIEGSEFDLFRTCDDWIRCVENITMEVHREEGDPSEIALKLRTLGFEVITTDQALRPVDPACSSYLFASQVKPSLLRHM